MKIIVSLGVGLDYLDRKFIVSFGVKVVNILYVVFSFTVDLGMVLLLAVVRRLVEGKWLLETLVF